MSEEAEMGLPGESSSDTESYKTADSGAGSGAGELAEEEWPTLGGKKGGVASSRGHRGGRQKRKKASCWQGEGNSAKISHDHGKAAAAPKDPSTTRAQGAKGVGGSDSGSKFRVQQERMGLIIGKGGQTLQSIRDQSGANIEINQSTKHMGYSTVRIKPGPGAAHARELLDARLSEAREVRASREGHEELRVPQARVGGIIGHSGETMKQIMRESGADLDFDQQTSKKGYSTLHFCGSWDAIAKAKVLVAEILDSTAGITRPQGAAAAKCEEMKINQEVVGCVIGSGGETLRSIQRDTGTDVRINQSTQEFGYSILRITGDTDSAVQAAKKAIQATIGGVREARQPSDDDLVCRVEKEHLGSFIGRGSRGVQRIVNQTGASIDVDQSTKDKGYVLVRIRPGSEASRAWALVTARAREAEAVKVAKGGEMRIEQRQVGFLMGERGKRLRDIEEQSGAELKLDRSTHWLGFATLHIFGVSDDVEEARGLVQECLAAAPARQRKKRGSDRLSASDSPSPQEGTDGSERLGAIEENTKDGPEPLGIGQRRDPKQGTIGQDARSGAESSGKEGAGQRVPEREGHVPTMSELRDRLHNAWDEDEDGASKSSGASSRRHHKDGEAVASAAGRGAAESNQQESDKDEAEPNLEAADEPGEHNPAESSAEEQKTFEAELSEEVCVKADSSEAELSEAESSAPELGREQWGGGLRPRATSPHEERPAAVETDAWAGALAARQERACSNAAADTVSSAAEERPLRTGGSIVGQQKTAGSSAAGVVTPVTEEPPSWTAASVAGREAVGRDLLSEQNGSESECEEVLVTGVHGIVRTEQDLAVNHAVAESSTYLPSASGCAEVGGGALAGLSGSPSFQPTGTEAAEGAEVLPWTWSDPWAAAAVVSPWSDWWWDSDWADEAWQRSNDAWQNWRPRVRTRGHRGGAAHRRQVRSGSRDEGSASPGGRHARSSSPAGVAVSVPRGRRGLSAPGGSEGQGHEKMEIAQRLVGWLIGRNGSIIDQIRAQTDAVVELDQSTSSQGFSVLHITGARGAVSSAREFVEERLKEEGHHGKVTPARRGRSGPCTASRAARAVLAALVGRWHSRGADGVLRRHEVAADGCRTLLAGEVHAERPLRLEGGDVLLGDRGRLLLDAISDRHATWIEEGNCQARSFWTRGWPSGRDWEDAPAARPRGGQQLRTQRESSPDLSPDFDVFDADEDFPPLLGANRSGSAHGRGQWPAAPELAKRFQ